MVTIALYNQQNVFRNDHRAYVRRQDVGFDRVRRARRFVAHAVPLPEPLERPALQRAQRPRDARRGGPPADRLVHVARDLELALQPGALLLGDVAFGREEERS